ncbi:hypothetical protein AAFF_G00173380 [Aldrovandia affinis]|uniref:Cytosolic carboxypeptidase N-terminal domain-containing protein n=1 Tax=Aldrovandia affinis TaxID=143900 RepID=A0AAD7SYW2_9TELE|nr:hypothetical protein AAFF_G00173380 [Aldrovandia affinis]
MMGYRVHCSSSSYDEDEDKCEDGRGTVLEKVPERGFDVDHCVRKRGDFGVWSLPPRTTQVLFEFRCGRAVPRLRETRPLYGSSAHASHVLSRWPRECQVIPEEIRHIEWDPPLHEPVCVWTNTNKRLQAPEAEDGTVVYDAGAEKEQFFSGSCLGGRRAPLKDIAVSLTGPGDTTLLFEARFESGNLQRALRVGEYDYDLTLRTDLYTERHTQWFYFRVKNTRAGVLYRFTISNLLKLSSLYREGQRPLLYSEEKARARHVGWHRAGQEVTYRRNGRQHAGLPCYSLSWALSFPYDRDTCYLAHCYPYTHSDLRAHLAQIEGDPERSRFCKVRTLCRTLAGNLVPVLTVAGPARVGGGEEGVAEGPGGRRWC